MVGLNNVYARLSTGERERYLPATRRSVVAFAATVVAVFAGAVFAALWCCR